MSGFESPDHANARGIQMKKKVKFEHPRMLTAQREEASALPEFGDEIYCNSVFCFNITDMLE